MKYFDWAATAPFDLKSFTEIQDSLETLSYNPSSIHDYGKEVSQHLADFRQNIGSVLGINSGKLLFTSGATESNNLFFQSLLIKNNPGRVLMSTIEHPSVYNTQSYLKKAGIPVDLISPDHRGIITPEKLLDHIKEDTKVVSIMALHNETGVKQPIKALVEAVRSHPKGDQISFHTDAVQMLGKDLVSLEDWDVNAASFSGHKVGALRGIGLLYLKKELEFPWKGGGQEWGMRSGTENTVGAAHLSKILKKGMWETSLSLTDFYKALKDKVKCITLPVDRIDHQELFSPFIINLSFDKIPGEVLLRVMNQRGFALSSGSACSSKKKEKTRAIESMGISREVAFNSVRISIGPSTTQEDLDQLFEALLEEVTLLQSHF